VELWIEEEIRVGYKELRGALDVAGLLAVPMLGAGR
jgi:hypothetical protein